MTKKLSRREAIRQFGKPIAADALRRHYAKLAKQERDRQDRERRLAVAMEEYVEMTSGYWIVDRTVH
jgi:hypothetical protein